MGIKFIRQTYSFIDEIVADLALQDIEPHDPAEVEAFARALSGLPDLTHGEVCDLVRDIPFPAGFRALRCTDITRNHVLGGSYSYDQLVPRTGTIVTIALVEPWHEKLRGEMTGAWVETIALPIVNKGVLELGLRYELRPPVE